MQAEYEELKESYTFEDLQDLYDIENRIANLLKVKGGNQFLTCEVRKDIFRYVLYKDKPRSGVRSTSVEEIWNILEEKYNIICEDSKNYKSLRHSIGGVMGEMRKKLPFIIGGRSQIGYYFSSDRYGEDVRDAVREYVEDYRCPEV